MLRNFVLLFMSNDFCFSVKTYWGLIWLRDTQMNFLASKVYYSINYPNTLINISNNVNSIWETVDMPFIWVRRNDKIIKLKYHIQHVYIHIREIEREREILPGRIRERVYKRRWRWHNGILRNLVRSAKTLRTKDQDEHIGNMKKYRGRCARLVESSHMLAWSFHETSLIDYVHRWWLHDVFIYNYNNEKNRN